MSIDPVRTSVLALPLLLALLILPVLPSVPIAVGSSPTLSAQQSAPTVHLGALFDSVDGIVIPDGIVVVDGSRVVCSGPADACDPPDEATVHDHGEAMILPGLIDLHVHARPWYVGAFLPAGVTTIRDANNDLATVRALRSTPGAPRIFASGPLIDGPAATFAQFPGSAAGGPDTDDLDHVMPLMVDGPDDARAAVAVLDDADVDLIKVYEQMPPAAFRAAVEEARERGLPVATDLGMALTSGLRGSQVDIVEAAEAGVHTIEHLSGLALAYQRAGGDPLDAEPDSAILDRIADALLATDVSYVPTLANFIQFTEPDALALHGMGTEGEDPHADEAEPRQIPPGVTEMRPFMTPQWQRLLELPDEARGMAEADRRLTEALFRRLHRNGAALGAGSDLPAAPGMLPGWALHLELEALVRAGMTPVEALQAATSVNARLVDRDDLGHLRPGARADLFIADGDPTTDIRASRNVRAVWFGGEAVDLDAAWADVVERLRAVNEEAR